MRLLRLGFSLELGLESNTNMTMNLGLYLTSMQRTPQHLAISQLTRCIFGGLAIFTQLVYSYSYDSDVLYDTG